jgi:hypothetical protein
MKRFRRAMTRSGESLRMTLWTRLSDDRVSLSRKSSGWVVGTNLGTAKKHDSEGCSSSPMHEHQPGQD